MLATLEPDASAALHWAFADTDAHPEAGPDAARVGRRLLFAMGPLWYFRGQIGELARWSTAASTTSPTAIPPPTGTAAPTTSPSPGGPAVTWHRPPT